MRDEVEGVGDQELRPAMISVLSAKQTSFDRDAARHFIS